MAVSSVGVTGTDVGVEVGNLAVGAVVGAG